MVQQFDMKGSRQELDDFKKNISLESYALSKGYTIDKKKSSTRHRVLHSADGNEIILVNRMRDGASHFLNLQDDRDRGSLIQFVMSRENASLGETRRILRAFSGSDAFLTQQAPTSKNTVSSEGTLSNYEQSQAMAAILKLSRELTHPEYLHSRSLSDHTLNSQAFKGRVFNYEHTDKAGNKHINTAFPIYNESGMISIEQRNTHFKGSLKDISTSSGLFFSNNSVGPLTAPLSKLVITEAPIDAMSHYQLHHKNGENTLYAATNGNLSSQRIELLQKAIDKRNPSQVVICTDNDNAGSRFFIILLSKLEPARPYINLNGSSGPVPEAKPKELEFGIVQAGKYYNYFDVSLKHQNPDERQKALENILSKISRLDPNASIEEKALQVEYVKTSPNETTMQLRLKNQHLPLAVLLATELSADRELKQGLAQPFILRHKPEGKDFNDDLKASQIVNHCASVSIVSEDKKSGSVNLTDVPVNEKIVKSGLKI